MIFVLPILAGAAIGKFAPGPVASVVGPLGLAPGVNHVGPITIGLGGVAGLMLGRGLVGVALGAGAAYVALRFA